MYWCVASAFQLFVVASVNSKFVRKLFRIPEYLPGTILEKKVNFIIKFKEIVPNIVKSVISDIKPKNMEGYINESNKQSSFNEKPKVQLFSQKPKKK